MRRELCQLISDVILGIASHFGVIQTEIGIIMFCNHPRSGFQFHLPKFLVHKDFYSFVLPEYNPVGNQVQETVPDPIWLEIGFGYTFWGGLQKLKLQWFAPSMDQTLLNCFKLWCPSSLALSSIPAHLLIALLKQFYLTSLLIAGCYVCMLLICWLLLGGFIGLLLA